MEIPELGENLENLHLLTQNRKQSDIFLLTSNSMRIISAMDQGFCAIPLTQFSNPTRNDFQLNLVEIYLLKLRYYNDMKSKNDIDFAFLNNGPIQTYRKHSEKKLMEKIDVFSLAGTPNGVNKMMVSFK